MDTKIGTGFPGARSNDDGDRVQDAEVVFSSFTWRS
jgi:hypothetical protein